MVEVHHERRDIFASVLHEAHSSEKHFQIHEFRFSRDIFFALGGTVINGKSDGFSGQVAFGYGISIAKCDVGDDCVMEFQIDKKRLWVKMDPTSFGGYVLQGTFTVLKLDVDIFQVVTIALLDADVAFVRKFGEYAWFEQREGGA